MNKYERMSIAQLKEERNVLTNEYYYWMSRNDCDETILEDIEQEIQCIESMIMMKEELN
jgi:hypothetical protein